MRIVLSRKGYDSSYGGMPSPVFIDKDVKDWNCRMFSLPIPEVRNAGKDQKGHKLYEDVDTDVLSTEIKYPVGFPVVSKMPIIGDNEKEHKKFHVHLDPDIRPEIHNKVIDGWIPILGQDSQAASHLRDNIEEGEDILFLFFGLFQFYVIENGSWVKKKDSREFHAIWGYMWCNEVLDLDKKPELATRYRWHPHCKYIIKEMGRDNAPFVPNNTLFIGNNGTLPLVGVNVCSYGVFKYDRILHLSMRECPNRTHWRKNSLPWLDFKNGMSNMSYNKNSEGREIFHQGDCKYFLAASIGQEFVVNKDISCSEKVCKWLRDIMAKRENRSWDGLLEKKTC